MQCLRPLLHPGAHRQGLERFLMIKVNGLEVNTGKILEENMVQSAIQHTLGHKLTFQLYSNLKHNGKSTLELLIKKILNVPKWPSYSFDLNRLENQWQDLILAV